MKWQQVLDDVWRFKDSCNVYAVAGSEGMLLIDAGTGAWLEHVDELPLKPAALLLTHFFRDHSAGAVAAAKAGIPIYGPQYAEQILADPQQHFRQRETYIIYDNLWNLYAPIEPIPLAGVMLDYDKTSMAGLDIEVVPLPGVTKSQSGYAVTLPGKTQRAWFCGEAIHSHGRLARVAPLQYYYNDLYGIVNCVYSAQQLIENDAQLLLPSLGEPILESAQDALSALQTSMRKLGENRPMMPDECEMTTEQPLVKVTDHVYMSPHSNAKTWFIISESGKVMSIDYGYHWFGTQRPGYPHPYNRRALLHSVKGLKQLGFDKIDMVLVSHFHDDHVAGIPVVQRLFGTECWASEVFADLLAEPSGHCFPCNWPIPARIDKRIALGQTVQWEEYTFHFEPMTGHTRFSTLIGFEADGKKFAHTGDQYFFLKSIKDFRDNIVQQNHVFRNGSLLDGFRNSTAWLLKHKPDIVLTGHTSAIHTDEHFFKLIDDHTQYWEDIHKGAMVLGDDESHFNMDSWGGWIWPYRTHLHEPQAATVKVTVRNPLPKEATLDIKLVGPTGWEGGSAQLTAAARAEVSCSLEITPDGPCRRQPFAVELTADGQPYGQVAEAQMTVGGEWF